jgi:hypothetical protein
MTTNKALKLINDFIDPSESIHNAEINAKVNARYKEMNAKIQADNIKADNENKEK